MAHGVPFHGMNDTINPPPGDEGTIAPLALFRSRGGANVSCHELDDAELEAVTRTGRVYIANFSGRTFFPVFVGSEATVRAIVADTGPTFERTPDEKLPPSRGVIRFNLAPPLIALAQAQGAGIAIEVDGPTKVKAHILAGDVGGNVPIAMPIALETVIATVLAVRELVDADDRNAASSCGVRDQLRELEQWLDGHGVDVDARCYPQRQTSGDDPFDTLCTVPGCDAITSTGICDDCDQWVTEEAAKLDREAIRREIINTPETADFMAGLALEAAHQRDRWSADHDAGKTPFDWFWLIGYLSQKAASAAVQGDTEKAKHHTISTAAALGNWHAALTGTDMQMRPGIEPPAASTPAAIDREA